jgi:hypothetical protein
MGLLPLAGLVMMGGKRRRAKNQLWTMLLALLCLSLMSIGGCGGGSSSTPVGSGNSIYKALVQGQTSAQPNEVTITTVQLTLE